MTLKDHRLSSESLSSRENPSVSRREDNWADDEHFDGPREAWGEPPDKMATNREKNRGKSRGLGNDRGRGRGKVAVAAETETDSAQGPPKGHTVQHMYFTVEADIMEFIMTSHHKSKLGNALAQHQSEVIWKPGSSTALFIYRGQEADTEAWQSACIEEMQSYMNKFAKCNMQVENDCWPALLDHMPSICTSLGKFFLLLKDIADSKQLKIICLNSDIKNFQSKFKDYLEDTGNQKDLSEKDGDRHT